MFLKALITLYYTYLHIFVLSELFSLWQEPYHTQLNPSLSSLILMSLAFFTAFGIEQALFKY